MSLIAQDADMSHAMRMAKYDEVSAFLASLSPEQLALLVDGAQPVGAGIGGGSAVLEVAGVPVFVKRVPLTDLERRPGNVMSTANLFDLPPFLHYGVGSSGFGAWRELIASQMATNWVRERRAEGFPLLYHWCALPGVPSSTELADVEQAVTYWGASPAVRERIGALANASASVVMFFEYIPYKLRDWLVERLAAGTEAISGACDFVAKKLSADVAFMNANGLLHFDTHFANVLTDGRRLYVADFGLAMSSQFELSAAEARFFVDNQSHDACYAVTQLVNWFVTNACGVKGGAAERNAYIRLCAVNSERVGPQADLPAVIRRYAPVAVVMNDFYWKLFGESRATPYPTAEAVRAKADALL